MTLLMICGSVSKHNWLLITPLVCNQLSEFGPHTNAFLQIILKIAQIGVFHVVVFPTRVTNDWCSLSHQWVTTVWVGGVDAYETCTQLTWSLCTWELRHIFTSSSAHNFLYRSEDYTFEDLFRTTHLWTTEINAFDFTVDVIIATFMYYLLSHNESEYQRFVPCIHLHQPIVIYPQNTIYDQAHRKRVIIALHYYSWTQAQMIFTLSTNMITSLCALVILITAVIMPRNAIFLAFLFVKSRRKL
jgi:hypothetical protein